MKITIEAFTHEMTDAVIKLILPIQQQAFGVAITPDLNDIASFYQRGAGGFWVAKNGAGIIGTIALIDIARGMAALRKMFVAADYRGGGLGGASNLLSTLMEHAGAVCLSDIYLGTAPIMAGPHRFYEKNRFQEIVLEDLPESFPVMAVDKRFYRLMI